MLFIKCFILNTSDLEVEVSLLRIEYEQLIDEIPDEEKCFYDYYYRCSEDICPSYNDCDYR